MATGLHLQLLELINVLGLVTESDSGQRALLAGILHGPLICLQVLQDAAVLPVDPAERKPKKVIARAQQERGTPFS